MKDLVLRTRLAVLKTNLEQVERIVSLVQEARSEVATLHNLLSGGETSVHSRIVNLLQKIRISNAILAGAIPLKSWKNVEQSQDSLKDAEEEAGDILKKFTEAQDILEKTQTRAVHIGEDHLGKMLKHEICDNATDCISILDEIEKSIAKKKGDADREGEQDAAQTSLEAAWNSYTFVACKKSQPIFLEYVDFLGGLALRDTGFDERVCHMADELIIKFERMSDEPWGSLTIPAHHEAVSTTLARSVIRLGYPEWTIWALPLAAHEFGHVVVRNKALQEFITRQGADERSRYYLEDYLADSFATYMMGPAYACPAILLRFNLSSAYEDRDEPATAKRAEVVFSMLGRIDAQDGTKAYSEIIKTLKDEWVAALRQAKQFGELDLQTKKQLDQCVAYVGDLLDKKKFFTPPKVAITQGWPDKLLQNKGIQVDGTEELREVLNAAWVCRLNELGPIEVIRDAVIALWDQILAKRRESRESGGRGRR